MCSLVIKQLVWITIFPKEKKETWIQVSPRAYALFIIDFNMLFFAIDMATQVSFDF